MKQVQMPLYVLVFKIPKVKRSAGIGLDSFMPSHAVQDFFSEKTDSQKIKFKIIFMNSSLQNYFMDFIFS